MNLKPEELVKALRTCSDLPTGNSGCAGCMFASLYEPACTDLLLRHAADQIERDQKEIAELKAKVEQYRALIPSWVIPMTPKEDYEDSKLSPEDAANLHAILRLGDGMTLMRLRELAVADQEGRVVVLPCKVGDTVYFVNAKQILEFAVVGYAVDETGISWVYSEHVDKTGHTNERTFSPDRISKTTFLTREEAEKALAEMEGK